MHVLFLGCHCDDIELGCGALISQKAPEWDISCITLSTHVAGIETNLRGMSERALYNVLGVRPSSIWHHSLRATDMASRAQQIWEILNKFDQPDLVFTQEPDEHQDHVTLYEVSRRAFKLGTSLITYRATGRSCPKFSPNLFIETSQEHLRNKQAAIAEYRSVYADKGYMSAASIEAQAVVDGLPIGVPYAEAFRIEKLTLACAELLRRSPS